MIQHQMMMLGFELTEGLAMNQGEYPVKNQNVINLIHHYNY